VAGAYISEADVLTRTAEPDPQYARFGAPCLVRKQKCCLFVNVTVRVLQRLVVVAVDVALWRR